MRCFNVWNGVGESKMSWVARMPILTWKGQQELNKGNSERFTSYLCWLLEACQCIRLCWGGTVLKVTGHHLSQLLHHQHILSSRLWVCNTYDQMRVCEASKMVHCIKMWALLWYKQCLTTHENEGGSRLSPAAAGSDLLAFNLLFLPH